MTPPSGAEQPARTNQDAPSSRSDLVRRYLTPSGERKLQEVATDYANLLVDDLHKQAVDDLHKQAASPVAQMQDPELTADSVLRAQQSVNRRLVQRGDGSASVDWPLFAPLLVTLGSVGASILANFLHAPWQQVLFIVFVAVGVVGLVQTARQHRQPR